MSHPRLSSRTLLAVLISCAATSAQSPLTTIEGQTPESGFGSTIANAGDVDGDGTPDILIGAPPTSGLRGAARVVSGADRSTIHAYINADPAGKAGDRLGTSVTGCGDLDGDGLAEFAVGQVGVGAQQLGGRARVYRGSDGSVLHELVATSVGQYVGAALADLGDVDGDGVDDLAVGAAESDAVLANAGAVFLLSGTTGAILRTIGGPVSLTIPRFGASVAATGDLDLDGVPDLLVGAPLFSAVTALHLPGAAYVISGDTGGVLASLFGADDDHFGTAVAAGADVDLDGTPDLLVGAPQFVGFSGIGPGYARLVSGATQGVLHVFAGEVVGDQSGQSVALADVDLDGSADILVGEPWWASAEHFKAGRARVWSGWDFALLAEVHGSGNNEQLGLAVAALGDLGDDLAPEWAVGVPNSVSNLTGQVQLFASTSAWTDLGLGLAGAVGVPVASAVGSLLPGRALGVSLVGAKPVGTTTLVMGTSALAAPFKGGVLVPNPDLLLPGLPLNGGAVSLAGDMPANLPSGFTFWLQFWTADVAGVKGFSASNALKAVAP